MMSPPTNKVRLNPWYGFEYTRQVRKDPKYPLGYHVKETKVYGYASVFWACFICGWTDQ